MSARLPIAVLISGNGSNLQALIDKSLSGDMQADISLVISNKADAFGLERARRAGVATEVLLAGDYDSREAYDEALALRLAANGVHLIVLSGFMRILSAPFVQRFSGKILNIHPSLLPKYPGLHTFQRALDAGDTEHGTTVHYVDETLDGGPIIKQSRIPILADDTIETLKERTQQAEYDLYWRVIDEIARKTIEKRSSGTKRR